MIKSLKDFKPLNSHSQKHALFKDLTGKTFGRLHVQKAIGQKRYNYVWKCRCECGEITNVLGGRLSSGKTTSCGCVRKQTTVDRCTTHGQSKTRTYRIWCGIKNRCRNPNVKAYPNYGGRGIKMNDRWFNSFSEFLKDMGEAPSGLCIERNDNNGNYEPENCRWATRIEQGRNSRNNHLITAFSKTLCISEWAQVTGIKASNISRRLEYGWPSEKALSTP